MCWNPDLQKVFSFLLETELHRILKNNLLALDPRPFFRLFFRLVSEKCLCSKICFFILFKLLLLFLLNWFDNFDTNLVGRKKLKCTYSPLCPPPPNASRNSYGYILKCYLNYYLHAVLGWYWVFFEAGGGSYSNFFLSLFIFLQPVKLIFSRHPNFK